MASRIEATYRSYFPAIRAKCARMLSDLDEAQDVAQETFIRFWRAGLADGDIRRTTAWIYTTSTRLAVDRMRRRERSDPGRNEVRAEEPASGDPESQLRMARALCDIARSVPAKELEVVILHRVDGLTHAETAELLSSSERTVRRLLCRFDERLERLGMKKEAIGEDS